MSGGFGTAVTLLGDTNRDNFDDIAISAVGTSVGGNPGTGRVYLYSGTASGLTASPSLDGRDGRYGGFGTSVAFEHHTPISMFFNEWRFSRQVFNTK